jgi:hypothetical protein
MISAWVLYVQGRDGNLQFEMRDGVRLDSNEPTNWGLESTDEVILVLQNASFVAAWLYGERVKGS